jgi:hypothetical protein
MNYLLPAGYFYSNQSKVFIKPFVLHQQLSQSAYTETQPQTASNADVEAQWSGNTF